MEQNIENELINKFNRDLFNHEPKKAAELVIWLDDHYYLESRSKNDIPRSFDELQAQDELLEKAAKSENNHKVNKPTYYDDEHGKDLFAYAEEGLFTHEEYVGFLKMNIMKYLIRYAHKGQKDSDLNKIIIYAKKLRDVEQDAA